MLWAITLFILSAFCPVRGYTIEGTIVPPSDAPADWYIHTRVHVDGIQHVGFVQSNGYFEVAGVASGSYVVEPIHPAYLFQTARVDINSKGRIRARRVNAPQPNAVKELPYPLRLSGSGKAVYFKPREQLRTLDVLFSPNVLYVLVPLLVVMLLTRLVNTNDPELQKELQQMNLPQQLPDVGEMLSSFSLFGGQKKTSSASHGRRRLTEDSRPSGSSSEAGFGSRAESSTPGSGRKVSKRKNL